jgi:putative ABC transport system ATP-binding protein
MHILQKLNSEGRTIILVTHEMDTAEHAERLIKIRDGQMMADEKIKHRKMANPEGDLKK